MLLRITSPLLGPNVLTALRLSLATVTLAVIMRALRYHWPWQHWRELVLLGLLSVAAPFMLFSWAALHLPAGYSALLNSTAVMFGTFSAAWLKEDTLTRRKVLGCLSGFAGVALIVRLGPVEPTPVVILAAMACIAAAAAFGVSTSLMKRAISTCNRCKWPPAFTRPRWWRCCPALSTPGRRRISRSARSRQSR